MDTSQKIAQKNPKNVTNAAKKDTLPRTVPAELRNDMHNFIILPIFDLENIN
jgi:hypothetical protein